MNNQSTSSDNVPPLLLQVKPKATPTSIKYKKAILFSKEPAKIYYRPIFHYYVKTIS